MAVDSPDETPLRDPARLAVLAETGLMSGEASETLDRFARLARATLSVPVALVSLVDERRQRFASAVGLPEPWATERETPLSHSFCQHVVNDGGPLIVRDAPANARVCGNLAIEDLKVIAYAGMPIESSEGYVLGSFCAIDHEPREWTEDELAILQDLASGVSREIELLRRVRRAEVSERALASANISLIVTEEQSAREKRSTIHDLATPLSVLRMGIDALQDSAALPGFDEVRRTLSIMERTCDHAVAILQAHRELPPVGGRVVERVDLGALCVEVVNGLSMADGPELRAEVATGLTAEVSRMEMRRSLENLVSNARRFAHSKVVVCARVAGEAVEILVEDDGPGLPSKEAYGTAFEAGARFHEADGRSQTGLGLTIVRELVERQGAEVSAEPAESGGARFVIRLPRPAAGA